MTPSPKVGPTPHSPRSIVPDSLCPSVHILTSSSLRLPRARSFRSNNSSSTSTCLDGSKFMKITTSAVFLFPPVPCVFYSASQCASLNFTYFIHFSILLFWMVPSSFIVGKTWTLNKILGFFFTSLFCFFFFSGLMFLETVSATCNIFCNLHGKVV